MDIDDPDLEVLESDLRAIIRARELCKTAALPIFAQMHQTLYGSAYSAEMTLNKILTAAHYQMINSWPV